MAPEMFDSSERDYAFPSDIWSLGVLLYRLCTNKFPFEGKTEREIIDSI